MEGIYKSNYVENSAYYFIKNEIMKYIYHIQNQLHLYKITKPLVVNMINI